MSGCWSKKHRLYHLFCNKGGSFSRPLFCATCFVIMSCGWQPNQLSTHLFFTIKERPGSPRHHPLALETLSRVRYITLTCVSFSMLINPLYAIFWFSPCFQLFLKCVLMCGCIPILYKLLNNTSSKIFTESPMYQGCSRTSSLYFLIELI